MQRQLDALLERLQREGYPHDFLMLTATFAQGDNTPPDPRLAEMVHRWNTEGRAPVLRFATPEMVLERMLRQADTPVLRGDWSDFWNFGAASSANETRVNRESANRLLAGRPALELSATFNKSDVRHAESLYFAFPLNLKGWAAHYDAAGVPVQWDTEQLDGSCKNWVTAGRWVSLPNAVAGATLACSDAPLAQIAISGSAVRRDARVGTNIRCC